MSIQYKFYEKEKGYEEIQAKIFNEAQKKYGNNSATAEQIKTRYNIDGFDPKGVRYAFSSDNKPLAYIQTRKDPTQKRIFIGYPWAVNECPNEIQNKMFDEMLVYIKQREPETKIVIGNIQQNWKEVHEFVKKKGGKIDTENKTYALDVSKVIKLDNTGFTMRFAAPKDETALAELASKEPGFDSAFANAEAMKNFFKEVVTNSEVLLIYQGDKLVSAGSFNTLEPDANGLLNLRFTATREYKFDYWKACVIELAKYVEKKGKKKSFFTIYDRQSDHIKFYEKFGKMTGVGTVYEIPR